MKNNFKEDIKNLKLKVKPIFEKKDHIKYVNDWRGQYHGDALAVLKPSNKFEISKILKFANYNKLPVVPQGGNTGLCGGATPLVKSNSLIINTEKLNKILSATRSDPNPVACHMCLSSSNSFKCSGAFLSVSGMNPFVPLTHKEPSSLRF